MVFLNIKFRQSPSQPPKRNHSQVQHIMPSKPDTDDQGSQFPTTQHFQGRNSTPSKPNTYHQGIQLSPTHAPNLSDWYPFNLQKKHFQVRNVTPLKPDTDDQVRKLPPTNTPNLAYFYNRRSRSCTGNRLHLAQNTSSQQLFPWF